MRLVWIFLFVALTAAASSIVTYMVTNPRAKATLAQGAIVDEFVAKYCHPEIGSAPPQYIAGEMAALSRVSIAAGLGPLAHAEYLKCKAGLAK